MADNRKNSGRVYHRSAKPRKSASRTFGESADWSDHEGCEALYTNRLVDLVKCLRPGQWVKNLLLLAAPFFAFFDKAARANTCPCSSPWDPIYLQERLGLAFIAFVLLSGAAYVLNDLADLPSDARNPLRKDRPLAARKVSAGAAGLLLACCLVFGLAAAWQVGREHGLASPFLWVAAAYVLLQPFYTFVARRLGAEVAAMTVAAGFVLRALAGAAAIEVPCSGWLLLCVFLGALFVALCKRRAQSFLKSSPQLPAAEGRILDLEIILAAASTIAAYSLYACAPATVAKFGTHALIWLLPLVLFGLFRFLRLTYGERATGNPESALFRDPALLGTIVAWLALCVALLR